jgi:hypothetical protein
MKKMLKRADGSYSQRGLWDNIRANKGSGKEPTKEMLKQEKKIKTSSKKETGGPGAKRSDRVSARADKNMEKAARSADKYNEAAKNSSSSDTSNYDAYMNKMANRTARLEEKAKNLKTKAESLKAQGKKTGGKKSSWLEESKELKFGGPSKKYQTAGQMAKPTPSPTMSTKDAIGQVFQGKMTAAQGQAAIGYKQKPDLNPQQQEEFLSKLKTYGKKTSGKKRMGGKNC